MKKTLFLLLSVCMVAIQAMGQNWQSVGPDILYGRNALLTPSPIRIGIGTAAPVTPLHVQNGCVLFDGTTGSAPASLTGGRMMWVPSKSALRAGTTSGGQWDNINIGDNSFATGNNTTASGASSVAMGNACQATATSAIAIGQNVTASSANSIAIGVASTSSDYGTVAMGENANASGGSGAVAIGSQVNATKYGAVALGASNNSDGDASFTSGFFNQATDFATIAMGMNSNATAIGAVAIGSNSGGGSGNYASGDYSVAIGTNSIASEEGSMALSTGSAIASGKRAVAMGNKADNDLYEGCFVFADNDPTTTWVKNTTTNQFMARAVHGFVFHTDPDMTDDDLVLTYDNGNLGVGTGTGNATEKLDVNGKLRIRNVPLNNSLTQMLVLDGDVVNKMDISALASTDQDWLTPSGSVPTSITDDIQTEGNVGIGTGTAIPDARLHIKKPACTGATGLRIAAEQTTVPFCSNVGDLIVAEGNDPNYSNVVEPRFVVNNTGSVGIGGGTTINPQRFLLDLYRGDMLFKGNPAECAFSYRFHYQYWMPDGQFFISPTMSNGTLIPGRVGLTMDTGGRVGVGTLASTTDRLTVNGNVRVTGHVLPGSTCLFDIGATATRWNRIFLCQNPIVGSDARLKDNIKDIEYGIEEIKKLRPVTYNLISNSREDRNLGLIAQETKEVIKEIVHVGDDPDHTMGIKYSELIPVLIKAIQEQQQMIDELQATVAQLQSGNQSTTTPSKNVKRDGALLYQNAPNPFGNSTEIKFYLPQTVKQAAITVFDMNGRQLKSFNIGERGEGTIVIGNEDLVPGMYLYSLLVDGNEVDTKRMVFAR